MGDVTKLFSRTEEVLAAEALQRDGILAALVNAAAEQRLLGSLLGTAKLVTALPAGLLPEHFGVAGHAQIFEAILAVASQQVDGALLLPVSQALAADPDQRAYCAELLAAAACFLPSEVATLGRTVLDLARRRQLIALTERLRTDVAIRGLDIPADALAATALSEIDQIINGGSIDHPAVSLNQAIDAAEEAIRIASLRKGPAGISTGFRSIDDQLGGLEPGTLHVLGGRPGMGKSALGWQIAIAAARQGVGTLVVSLEMSAVELGRRALATVSSVPVWRMKRGMLLPGDSDLIVKARRTLRDLPLTIEDGGGLTSAMISLKARSAKRKHGLGLVMVDHLHIVRPEDADMRAGATWATGRVSGAMKRLAKALDVPVLLLAQLSRLVEGREDKRPVLQDLRQSGDIEQDADTVSFVYRPEYYLGKEARERTENESAEKYACRCEKWQDRKNRLAGKAELIVEKVRDGKTGIIHLTFRGETTSFSEAPAHE